MKRLLSASLFFILFLGAVPRAASSADLGPLLSGYVPGPKEDNGWSVFVGKDFEIAGSVAELEGRAFVRGNFKASKYGYVIGRAGAGSGVFPSLTVPALVVGGNVVGRGSINTPGFAPIQVGSNLASTVSVIDRGAVVTGGVDYAAADSLIAELHTKSQYWGALPDTAGGSITRQWGGVYIAADGENGNPKTWVFNLTFDLTSSYWGVVFSGFESGDTILVNCKKTASDKAFVLGVNSYTINGVQQNSPFGPKLLWNFPDAKTVALSGYAAFQGSVLVGNPESVTTVSVPGHDGRFASCGSVIHSGTQGCEFHNYPFAGALPELPVLKIGGTVRGDADRNYAVSDPDVPLAAVRLNLYSDPNGDGDPADGVIVQTVLTDAAGHYLFQQLLPGQYVVVSTECGAGGASVIPVDVSEGSSTDNDMLSEIDPSGFFYDAETGLVVLGATVSVEGAGAVLRMDGSNGEYMFVSTNREPGTYTLNIHPPAGYIAAPQRQAESGSFDPTGMPDPVVMGSFADGGNPASLLDASAGANPYYLSFVLESGDPLVINNNIPLVKTVALGNRVWNDRDGDGVQDAGEDGLPDITIRLLNAAGSVVATRVTAADGGYLFDNLAPGSYRIEVVVPEGSVLTVSDAGDDQSDSDVDRTTGRSPLLSLAGGCTTLTVDAGLYVPGVVHGFLFVDHSGDAVRDAAATPIVDALVRLADSAGGVRSTRTDAAGGYTFAQVPVGPVTVLVSRINSTLSAVPAQEPMASDEDRNRALPDAVGFDAYVAFNVVSGYGVLANQPAEPLNIGFSSFASSTLSTAIDFRAFVSGRDAVKIELWTSNESGYNDIVVYAWIGNAWVEVGRVPSEEIVGEGSNKYTIKADVLSPDGAYYFRIVDEAGHVHDSGVPVGVTRVRLNALRFEMDTAVLTFTTAQGSSYVVKVSDRLLAPADAWTTEFVSVQKSGGWAAYSDKPFMAGPGAQTAVRIPKNRKKAFFKIEQVNE